MELEEGACAALVVEHLHKEFHTEKFSELLSDNSEAELTGFTFATDKGKKRKRGNLTDVSCSSYSSGAGSPLNLPFSLGFIGRNGFESTDENSDSSRTKSLIGPPGYQSATTAVVSDSEDEIDFPNDVTDLDSFAVEYEPPETNSEDENDGDESEEEPVIVIPSSSDEEDPGADGGDEYDMDSDNEDSWECPECWTMNHPMTTKCLMCWKERTTWVQQLNRTTSAPVESINKDIVIIPTLTRSKTSIPFINTDIRPGSSLLLDKKIAVSLSRSSSSCSSTAQTCDSGICVSSCETDTEKTITTSDGKNTSNDKDIEIKSGLPCTSSTTTVTSILNKESSKETVTQMDGVAAVPPCNYSNTSRTSTSESQIKNHTIEGSSQENEESLHLCVICSTEPRNASIIHGRSGHQVCCITCAEKLKASKKRCPVCRKRINFVIKNFL